MNKLKPSKEKILVYIISLGEKAREEGIKILQLLRKNRIPADMDYEGKSIKGAMRKAESLKADKCLILGDNEIEDKVITLKDMSTGTQDKVNFTELIKRLKC